MTPNERYKKLFTESKTIPTELCEETTYIDLAVKAMLKILTPGKYYRITDYETVTSGYNSITSAGHVFDIVVLAISDSEFSYDAFALKHNGDEYFSNSLINKWEIKYDFWGDTYAQFLAYTPDIDVIFTRKNGTQIIPYFNSTVVDALTGEKSFLFEDNGVRYYVPYTDNLENLANTKTIYAVTGVEESKNEVELQGITWGAGADSFSKGYILHMKDEFGNEADYDFKNILYTFDSVGYLLDTFGVESDFITSGKNYYTFTKFDLNGNVSDATVGPSSHISVHNVKVNRIENSYASNITATGLPEILLFVPPTVGDGPGFANISFTECYSSLFLGPVQDSSFVRSFSLYSGENSAIAMCSFNDCASLEVFTTIVSCNFNEVSGVTIQLRTGTVPQIDITIYGWNFNVVNGVSLTQKPAPNDDVSGWYVTSFMAGSAVMPVIYKFDPTQAKNIGIYYYSVNDTWTTF